MGASTRASCCASVELARSVGSDPELSSRQLQALARVDELLGEAGIDYWVFGGWAVDLHAGSLTRAHDDVDIAVWSDDVETIEGLLEVDGWRHAPSHDEDGGTGYERDGVRLELTYLCRDEDGVFTPLRHGRAQWPTGIFGDDVRELNGMRARVAGLAGLTSMKSFRRDDPADAAKDGVDLAILSELRKK